jgi:ssDNA-binding Zn-finger/Zn-ribbon topoisomerase 1
MKTNRSPGNFFQQVTVTICEKIEKKKREEKREKRMGVREGEIERERE